MRTRTGLAITIAGALAALVTVACGTNRPGVGADRQTIGDTITVEILNDNFYDANISWLFQGGAERRLGTVRSHTRETFTLRWQPAQLVFTVDLIGAGEFISDPVNPQPGDYLQVRLPSTLDRSPAGSGFRRRR